MPWCDDCSKFWNPNSMPPDGTCPTCGRVIADPPDDRVPWHFWLLVAVATLYLGWRAVQGFQWLAGNDHTAIAIAIAAVLVALCVWVGVAWFRRVPADDDAPHAHDEPGSAAGE